jgi:TrpR-related protein YerC/YecD
MNPLVRRHAYHLELTELEDLFNTLHALESKDALIGFIHDLCTRQELKLFAERWSIAKLVNMGFPYRAVSNKTGASAATIARVANSLSFGSGHLAGVCRVRQAKLEQKS